MSTKVRFWKMKGIFQISLNIVYISKDENENEYYESFYSDELEEY